MAKLPKKATERIAAGIKRFQPILASSKSRDVNESDTALIVSDLLSDIFGYDSRQLRQSRSGDASSDSAAKTSVMKESE